MAEAASAGSLTSAFKKVNHWRHILMDLSMLGMAIAAGGGFLDPIASVLKAGVSGIPDLFMNGPGFLATAFEQASNGVWYTGAETAMSHGGHAMAGVAAEHAGHMMGSAASEPILSDTARAVLGG